MILQNIDQFDDIGPCVIMASPGMMQSGLSRQLFEAWCTDKRNGVIIAGYCVEGTLAKVRREGERGRGERGGGREKGHYFYICFSKFLNFFVFIPACDDRAI